MNINLKDLTPDQIKDLRQQLAQIDKVPHYETIKRWKDAFDVVKPEWYVRCDGKVLKEINSSFYVSQTNIPSELHAKSLLATAKLMVISEALNPNGWKADWKDEEQGKYAIELCKGRLRTVGFTYTKNQSIYFATKEIAEYAMKQFEELFLDMLMIERDGK